MTGTVVDKVRDWLKKGGVPLEYAAARTLARSGFGVQQRAGYGDAQEPGTVREIDVLATLHLGEDRPTALTVECKHSESPWVVLTHGQPLTAEQTIAALITDDDARARMHDKIAEFPVRLHPEFIKPIQRPGFSAVVMGAQDGERDLARIAMAQAVSGAFGFAAGFSGRPALAWPTVVIDGPLVSVGLIDQDDAVVEIDRARVAWHTGPFPHSVVLDIVTLGALADYSAKAIEGLASLGRLLSIR